MEVYPPNPSVPVPLDWDKSNYLIAPNSWGAEWGNYGFAAITRAFFEQNFYEGWSFSARETVSLYGSGLVELHELVGSVGWAEYHRIELIDLDNGRSIGWTFYCYRQRQVFVEELFVMPEHRGKGFGTRLLASLKRRTGSLPITFWVTFADVSNESSVKFLTDWFGKQRLYFNNTLYRFAAYEVKPRKQVEPLRYVEIPPKPAYVLDRPERSKPSNLHTHAIELQLKHGVSDDMRELTEQVFSQYSDVLARLAE